MHETRFCPWCAAPLESRAIHGYERKACPRCHFVEYQDPKVAVAAVLAWAGGLLLGKRAISPGKGLWTFPSGYVDRGEVLEEAACREVLEEMNLEVRVDGLVGVYSDAGHPVVLVVYSAEVLGGQPVAGDEMSELAVYPPGELPAMAFGHDQQIVADWATLHSRLRGETVA